MKLTRSCHAGTWVTPQRIASVIIEVVGKRLSRTMIGLSGLLNRITMKKKGTVKNRLK